MAATPALTYTQLCKDISSGTLAPIYLIHGEESYYADELVKKFEALIPDEARDFDCYTHAKLRPNCSMPLAAAILCLATVWL